jgi:oxygen-independent coproporphyrinogen-3 oxidase
LISPAGESPPARALGVYVHWPYCARICPYCDFNVVRDREAGEIKSRLVAAIIADLAAQARLTGPMSLVSVFFGGGTPSLMAPADVARILDAARALWTPRADLEVTLEANPTDAEASRFAALARAGVNRLSLGVQSLNDRALKALGRNHDAAQARRAAALARDIFPRLSIDLIHGLPGQDAQAWAEDLAAGLALGPEHISAYELTLEPGTAFDRAVSRGALVMPGDDARADLFDLTQDMLRAAGFEAYEVSNHARGPGARARHNLLYWRGEDYVGVGPGAHGRLTLAAARWALETPRRIGDYLRAARDDGGAPARQRLTPREAALERLLMGLRTWEGVPLADLAPLAISAGVIAALGARVEIREGRLMATREGRPVLDSLIARLAGAAPGGAET